MAKLCIPANKVDEIKKALVSGKLSIEKLYDMPTSEARRAEFAKYLPSSLAQFATVKFEAAAASRNRNALKSFVQEITTPKKKKDTKNILSKIAALEDADLLDPDSQTATFTDLFSHRLGVAVTAEEIKIISEKAAKIEAEKENLLDADGLPTDGYFAALVDMDKYVNSLDPTHNLKVLTGTIGRGNMLLNIPPAVINTVSNAVQGVMQAVERRIASNQFKGLNNEYARKYALRSLEIFHKTGYDISRMYAEDIRLGEHIIHSEGPGIIRKTGRGISKVVFKYMLGYSDVISASVAAADSLNIATTKIAQLEGLKGEAAQKKALELFKDAISMEIQSTDAVIAREQAIADAEFATWTNKGYISNASMKLRDWLNDVSGDLQIGYWNIPFVKTGANVIQFGIEATPVGSIAALAKFKSAWAAAKDPVSPDMKPLRTVMRLAVRSGLGTILSMMLASLIPPDDFFSAYEAISQKEREMLGLKKGVYNAVKIGGKWVSLDFFGALGAGFVGMMYARKYGKGVRGSVFKYAQGVGKQILQVPGIRDFEDLFSSIKEVLEAETVEEAAVGGAEAAINSIRSRVIPGIVNTIAKGTDTVVRRIDRGDIFARTKAGIPGLRQTLEPKISQTTGEPIPEEGFISNLLFGSRVKTANESALIDEITRLDTAGFSPAISEIDRTSSRVKGLKEQLSDERFTEALKFYGREYGRRATKLITTRVYRNATDEEKKNAINSLRSESRNAMLKKFRFKKPKKKRGRKKIKLPK